MTPRRVVAGRDLGGDDSRRAARGSTTIGRRTLSSAASSIGETLQIVSLPMQSRTISAKGLSERRLRRRSSATAVSFACVTRE